MFSKKIIGDRVVNWFSFSISYCEFKYICFRIISIDKFKIVADKDMRKISNIVENLIRRYVESRV